MQWNKWIDGWMNEWMNGAVNIYTNSFPFVCIFPLYISHLMINEEERSHFWLWTIYLSIYSRYLCLLFFLGFWFALFCMFAQEMFFVIVAFIVVLVIVVLWFDFLGFCFGSHQWWQSFALFLSIQCSNGIETKKWENEYRHTHIIGTTHWPVWLPTPSPIFIYC